MKVLVAGDRGYIGAVMVPFLRTAGHQVDGLDLGLYEGAISAQAPRTSARVPRAISGTPTLAAWQAMAVVCLAALSNDPLGDLEPGGDIFGPTWRGRWRWPRPPRQGGTVERFPCSRPRAASMARSARPL